MQIIIAAHGFLARELLNSAELICGKQQDAQALTFTPGENTDTLTDKYSEYTNNFSPQDSILILVDLFGGTPYNAAAAIAANDARVEVLTGASLPLLLELLMLRNDESMTADRLVRTIRENQSSYVQSFRLLEKIDEEDEL